MHIQYYGLSCVKLTTKPGGRGADDVTIVINPFTRTDDLTPPQLTNADIVIVSTDVPEYYSDAAKNTDILAITTPGEYAMHGAHMIGVGMLPGTTTVPATLHIIESEGLKVAIVTATDVMLNAKQFEEMNGTHILIVAVGGNGVFSGEQAVEIARKIEPSYVIPVHAALPGNKTTKDFSGTDVFCGKIGTCPKESVSKVVIKDKDCEDATTQVVLMIP